MYPTLLTLAFVFAAGSAAAADVTMAVQCSLDDAAPAACAFGDTVTKEGTHTMEFVRGDQHTTFVGRRQGPWWSGRLDGRPAMGYEINRGHMVIATSDLESTFEWWSKDGKPGAE